MSDQTPNATPTSGIPPRRPSPGAQAASRARRIGGRPLPGPRSEEAGPRQDETGLRLGEPGSDGSRGDKAAPRREKAGASPRREKPGARSRTAATAGSASAADLEALHRRLERLRWLPALIAGLATVVLLAIGVWQAHDVWWGSGFHDRRDETRQEVLAAAKPCTAAILSYDYRHLSAAQQAGEACATGTFKSDYVKAMATVTQLAPQEKTVQSFEVAKGGVQSVSADGKQWVVLLYGQISVTNAGTKPDSPRLDITTAVVTLERVGRSWLISNMQTPG